MADPRHILGLLIKTAFGRRDPSSVGPGRRDDADPPTGDSIDMLALDGIVLGDYPTERDASPASGTEDADRPGQDPGLVAVLAVKVMRSHLQNQYQLLDPPPADFRELDPNEAELLIRAMIAAAHADGHLTPEEERRIYRALDTVGLSEEERHFLADAFENPKPLDVLLPEIHDVRSASRFYAASLLAIDSHSGVNRSYLHYLATRLQLPTDMVIGLHRRFGFGR